MRLPRPGELKSFIAEATRQMAERPLYSVGIRCFRLGVALAALRSKKARLMMRGRKKVWKTLAKKCNPNDRNIWIHAASLGEFEQGRPLIEELKRRNPEYKIILSFFSSSGYEVKKDWEGADCVIYLPFDTPRNAAKLVNAINPEKAFFIKYELWRNLLHELNRRSVPTYLVSASFPPGHKILRKKYRWYALWLRWFTQIFVQNKESQKLLNDIGINNVTVAGDTRFDRVAEVVKKANKIPPLHHFRNSSELPVIIFGSSWREDEILYFPWLLENRGKMRAIIAPHEFDINRLEAIRNQLKFLKVVLLSEMESESMRGKDADVILIDCFGLLSSAYQYADITYVGGGFGKGIHNILEPAAHGKPVVFGPNHFRFVEGRGLLNANGGFPIENRKQLHQTLDRLISDKTFRMKAGQCSSDYILKNVGATRRTLSSIT